MRLAKSDFYDSGRTPYVILHLKDNNAMVSIEESEHSEHTQTVLNLCITIAVQHKEKMVRIFCVKRGADLKTNHHLIKRHFVYDIPSSHAC